MYANCEMKATRVITVIGRCLSSFRKSREVDQLRQEMGSGSNSVALPTLRNSIAPSKKVVERIYLVWCVQKKSQLAQDAR